MQEGRGKSKRGLLESMKGYHGSYEHIPFNLPRSSDRVPARYARADHRADGFGPPAASVEVVAEANSGENDAPAVGDWGRLDTVLLEHQKPVECLTTLRSWQRPWDHFLAYDVQCDL